MPCACRSSACFLGGLGIGGSSILGPVYIAQLAPAHLRGRLVGTFQINIVIGILLAYLSNFLIGLLNLGPLEWRLELGAAAVPSIIFFLLLFAIPQSARWLRTQSRFAEARTVLGIMGSPNPDAELHDIRDSLRLEHTQKQASLFERAGGSFRYRKPILLAFAIGAFNQLSGINAILYYLNDIFAAAEKNFNANSPSLRATPMNATSTALWTLVQSICLKNPTFLKSSSRADSSRGGLRNFLFLANSQGMLPRKTRAYQYQ